MSNIDSREHVAVAPKKRNVILGTPAALCRLTTAVPNRVLGEGPCKALSPSSRNGTSLALRLCFAVAAAGCENCAYASFRSLMPQTSLRQKVRNAERLSQLERSRLSKEDVFFLSGGVADGR